MQKVPALNILSPCDAIAQQPLTLEANTAPYQLVHRDYFAANETHSGGWPSLVKQPPHIAVPLAPFALNLYTMKYFLITILTLLLLILGCKNHVDNPKIVTVDIANKPMVSQINLNDYVTDLRLIRLETNDSSLINWFSGYIGEKYIIAIENEKVLLFSSKGEYLRTIMRRGKGPYEFTQIDAWTVDESETRFLFHDVRKSYIFNYNLDNQKQEENIPFVDHGYLSNMVLINDTTISILPSMFAEYGYLFFNQTISGQITGGIFKENIPHPGAWAGRSPIFKTVFDNSIIFQPAESDTVFRIDGVNMVPVFNFLVEKPQKSGDITTGTYVNYLYSDKNQLLIKKSGYELMITPTSSSITQKGLEYFSFDLKNLETSKIDHFSLEIMDLKLEVSGVSFPNKKEIRITYQAIDFKKLLDEAIKRENGTNSNKEKLIQLNSEISENDNPILITGKWK